MQDTWFGLFCLIHAGILLTLSMVADRARTKLRAAALRDRAYTELRTLDRDMKVIQRFGGGLAAGLLVTAYLIGTFLDWNQDSVFALLALSFATGLAFCGWQTWKYVGLRRTLGSRSPPTGLWLHFASMIGMQISTMAFISFLIIYIER